MAVHASHGALPFPIKGARYSLLVGYLDADGDPTAPTTPDTEVSKDNAAAADCTEEVSATSGMDGMGLLTLTGDEMNCSTLALNAKAASGPKATLATLYPRVLGIITSGTAQAGAAGTMTLASGAPAYDLAGCILKTTGGTGGGGGSGSLNNQARVITAYNITTKVATVVPSWETTPDNTTTYEVLASDMMTPAAAAGAVWEEVLSSTLRNTQGSTGQRLRRVSAVATDGVVNDAAATTTSFVVGGSVTTDDFYNDQVLVFTTGALAGQSKPVLDYDGGTKTVTLSEPLTSAPANGVEFILIPVHVHPVSQIAEGVWGESLPGSYGAGEAGNILGSNLDVPISDIPNAAANADAVWDEALAGHAGAGSAGEALAAAGSAGDPWATSLPGGYGAGTAGKIVGDNLDAAVSTRSVLAAADVWAYGTRTLSSFGTLVADIWAGMTNAAANKQADHVWRRTLANIAASSDGDAVTFRSPLGALRKLVNKVASIVGVLTIYEEDDTTVAGQQAMTTDPAAENVTALDTA